MRENRRDFGGILTYTHDSNLNPTAGEGGGFLSF
jgi:hypothetical protein